MTRVLLVEDNEMNRDMLRRRLERKGFEVTLAGDGLEAICAASERRPDLILMDLNLPNLDGWEATRRIKADETLRQIPIMALTANALVEDRQKAIDAGCDEFETKPVNFTRLLERIDSVLVKDNVGND
ncbi:MAG: response regulator [Hyphomicrobiales bacterium]|nr:response regulator [Hyphomicrobiales bacterium]